MNQAQKVTGLIRNLLLVPGSIPDDDGAALAREYADLCNQANDRLQLCANYIASNRQSEAIHAAESKPELLDLCTILELEDSERWQKLCSSKKWPVAPAIDGQSLERINECYSSAMALEPIVKEYRKAARAKELKQAIALLRRLKKVDPQNGNWHEDLKAFETKRIAEIQKESMQAREKDDIPVLSQLLREIDSAWQVQPSDSLKNEIRSAYDQIRRKKAQLAGREIAERISNAFSALDYDAAASAFNDYDTLSRTGYFEPDKQTAIQYEEALTWFTDEKTAREREAAFNAELQKLTKLVDAGIPVEGMRHQLHVVSEYGLPFAPDIATRANNLSETWDVIQQRKRKIRAVLTVGAAFCLAGVILAGVWFVQFARLRSYWNVVLKARHEQMDSPGFVEALDQLASERRQLFGKFLENDPLIVAWREKSKPLKATFDARRNEIKGLQARLGTYAAQKYNADYEVIDRDISQLETISADEESRAFVAKFRQDWIQYENANLEMLAARIASQMPSLSDFERKPLTELDGANQDLDTLLQNGLLRKAASPAYLQKLKDYQKELATFRKWFDERHSAYQRIINAIKPAVYVDALKNYDQKFKDEFMLSSIKSKDAIIRQWTLFEAEWNMLNDQQKQRDDIVATGYRAVIDKLDSVMTNPNMYGLQWYKYQSHITRDALPHLVILRGEIESEKSKTTSETIKRVDVCTPKIGDREAQFFQRVLDKKANPVLMDHCKFFKRFSSEVASITENQMDIKIARAILTVLDQPVWDGEINTWDGTGYYNDALKLLIVDFLVSLMSDLVGENAVEWATIKQQLAEIKAQEVDWLLWNSPKVKTYSRECKKALEGGVPVRDTAIKYIIQRQLYRELSSAGWQWIARGPTFPGDSIEWKVGDDRRPAEMWSIDITEGYPRLNIVLRKESDKYNVYGKLQPGDVLIGPAMDFSTDAFTLSLLSSFGSESLDSLKAFIPPIWPVIRQ